MLKTDSILKLIGRTSSLFDDDISSFGPELSRIVANSRFLVLGGAGSIGQAVVKEIFKRSPIKLHAVDSSENNLVELVRDIRSSFGYIEGDFQTFALDIGSQEYDAFIKSDGAYDYVLNLSALKHVRSEKDPFTLMRMIDVNILNTEKTIYQSLEKGANKYFCVSTDKAANPVNMMGASKRIMELFLMQHSAALDISTARFANVAFSNGSLLEGFVHRLQKQQPIVAPDDVRRYFVTPEESGQLCLMSCLLGENRDIFFPKLNESLHLITFSTIAEMFLREHGLKPLLCETEEEARQLASGLPNDNKWPCFFAPSDTTGEKSYEEFFMANEVIDLKRFHNLGVVKNNAKFNPDALADFKSQIQGMKANLTWSREELISLFHRVLPDFEHKETGKFLDGKM